MEVGYYTGYFSTLLKSNWALSVKQRWDAKRVVRYSKKIDINIYKTLPEMIEVEHRVSKALEKEELTIEELNEFFKYSYQLVINSSYEDEIILRAEKHLIENMEKFHELMDNMKRNEKITRMDINNRMISNVEKELEYLSKKFALIIKKQTEIAIGRSRDEMGEVMNLITQSHKHNKDTFMTAFRQKFSSITSQTYLAKLAFNYDIRHEKKLVLRLERLSVRLEEQKKLFERILNNIDKRYNELPKTVQKFKEIVEESEKDIGGAFFYSYKIKKRDFLMMLTMLVNSDVFKNLNAKWVRMHFMPAIPTEARTKGVEKIEEKAAEKIHVVAQALRISINAEEDIEKRVMPLLR